MEIQSFEQATRQYLRQSIENLQFGIKPPNRRALFITAFLSKMFLPLMTTWITLSRMDKFMLPFDPSKTTRFQIHTSSCHLLWFSTLLIILLTPWMMTCLWKMYQSSYLKANRRRRSCRRHDPMALHSLSSLNISTFEHANRSRRKPMIKQPKKGRHPRNSNPSCNVH